MIRKLHERVAGWLGVVPRWAIGRPRSVLVIAAVVTLGAAPGVERLKLRVGGSALVPRNTPEARTDQAIRERFGIEDQIVVVVRSRRSEGIFNPATVQLVRELTASFSRLPGLGQSNLMSLATETSFRFRPGKLVLQTLLEPPLQTKEDLEQLRQDLEKIGLYTGTLVSSDGACTAILIGVPTGMDCTRLYKEVSDIVARNQTAQDEVLVSGPPVAESLLGIHILEDLGVPKAWLGAGTLGSLEASEGGGLGRLEEARLLLARRVGLVPASILVMMVVLFFAFRNVPATLVPLPGVLATLLFIFGVMGWLGVPVYLTIAVMPVLLTATGVTNDIYLFNRYFTALRENPQADHVMLVQQTFDRMVPAITSTSLTTGIGFLSFGLSPLEPVHAFGLCTAGGVLFGFLCSMTVVPALLALINPAWFLPGRQARGSGAGRPLASAFARLAPEVVRWRWLAIGSCVLMAALTPFGLRRLVVQDSWTGGFDPRSEFSRATRLVNEEFNGMHLLFVCCDATKLFQGEIPGSALAPGLFFLSAGSVPEEALRRGNVITVSPIEPPGAGVHPSGPPAWRTYLQNVVRRGTNLIVCTTSTTADDGSRALAGAERLRFEIRGQPQLEPPTINALDHLGAFIREQTQDEVGGVLGPADYLRTTHFLLRANDPEAKVLPASAAEGKALWDEYLTARGPRRLRQVVDEGDSQSLMTVFLKDANYVDTARLMGAIRDYERTHLAPIGIKVSFAGDVAVSQSLIHGIVVTQLQSLAWSLAGIFLVTAFFGGSLRWGFYCLLPSLLAVVVKFAVMGWADIPLGVATSMFAAMTLGIGVICAIHLLECYRQTRAAGEAPMASLSRAMGLTGPPALINTLSMTLGFGVLTFSQVPANARLGLLLVLGLVNCFVASLLLLPVLLHWRPPAPSWSEATCEEGVGLQHQRRMDLSTPHSA